MNRKEYFFAKLKPLTKIMKTDRYMELAYIDFDSEEEFIRQRYEFLNFYANRYSEWIMFVVDTNGYIYVEDSDDIIIVDKSWLMDFKLITTI